MIDETDGLDTTSYSLVFAVERLSTDLERTFKTALENVPWL